MFFSNSFLTDWVEPAGLAHTHTTLNGMICYAYDKGTRGVLLSVNHLVQLLMILVKTEKIEGARNQMATKIIKSEKCSAQRKET